MNVAPAMELNAYQQQLFQPISEQIERLSDPKFKTEIKNVVARVSNRLFGSKKIKKLILQYKMMNIVYRFLNLIMMKKKQSKILPTKNAILNKFLPLH